MSLEIRPLHHLPVSIDAGGAVPSPAREIAQAHGSLIVVTDSTLTVVFEDVEDGWVQARIAEVPAVITVGRDRDEARSLVEDALREYIRAIAGDAPTDQVAGDVERVRLSLRPSD